MTAYGNPTPERVLSRPADERALYCAFRNAGAFSRVSARPLARIAVCHLGWRMARAEAALEKLVKADLLREATTEDHPLAYHVNEAGKVDGQGTQAAPLPAECWPPALLTLWFTLTFPERRRLTCARWRWRGWVNPGGNVPKARGRPEYRRAHDALYRLEYRFRRARPWCRGADGDTPHRPKGRTDY